QPCYDAAQDLAAQHRAAIVNGRQHHRLFTEERSQGNRGAALIAKDCIEGNLSVQILIDADTVQVRRQISSVCRLCAGGSYRQRERNAGHPFPDTHEDLHRGSGATFPSKPVRRVPASGCDSTRFGGCFWGGIPRAAKISMARSIGIATVPFFSSSQ